MKLRPRNKRLVKNPAPKKTKTKTKASTQKPTDNAYRDTTVSSDALHASKSYLKNALKVTVKRTGTGVVRFDVNQNGSYEFAGLSFHTDNKDLKKRVNGLIDFLIKHRDGIGEVCDIYDEKNAETAKDRKKTAAKFHKARAKTGNP